MSEFKFNNAILDEDLFWNIIDLSLKNSTDIDEQQEFLVNQLEKMSFQEMVSFKLKVDQLTNDIHTSEMWCAGYLMNGGCSDDGFDYFKNWIVSRGKEIYYKAKENPDNLVVCIGKSEDDYYEFESLDYVAIYAFENLTGEELWEHLPDGLSKRQEFDFNWEDDDDESMKAICPKIFKKVEW